MARPTTATPYLTLDRYREIMNIPMCAFNGVENPAEVLGTCNHIWTQWERDMLAQSLQDAEDNLATYLGFWLGKRWLEDPEMLWRNPVQLMYGFVDGLGQQGLTAVTPSASDFTTDPATITVASASFTGGIGEIYIIETSTGKKIVPDKVTTVGANYVISISQCKLIEWDDLESQVTAIAYNAAFPATTWLKLADLTVYREYIDTSDQATVIHSAACDECLCCSACSENDYDACGNVLNERIGTVRIHITATCFSDDWCCYDSRITVNYRAGTTTTPGWEQAVIRLAHTYMALEPCGCAQYDVAYQRDTKEPTTMTAERVNCPLGTMNGAWYAWKWLQNHRLIKAFML